jgi:hypothetical protein
MEASDWVQGKGTQPYFLSLMPAWLAYMSGSACCSCVASPRYRSYLRGRGARRGSREPQGRCLALAGLGASLQAQPRLRPLARALPSPLPACG